MYRTFILAAVAVVPLTASAVDLSVSGQVTARDGNNTLSIGFSNNDRQAVDRYYRDSGSRYHERDGDRREDRREREGERREHGKEKHGHGRGGPPGQVKRGDHVPPGLAKKGGLPPGLQRNQRLPEDVSYQPLPRELEKQMPPLPSPDYVRVQVGGDIAILNKKTRVVLDFMRPLN